MSYPVLQAAKAFARVDVRRGRGAQSWQQMAPMFSGACDAGQEWKGGEGEKLSARHCLWPDDPASTLSQPYTVAGVEGLEVGHEDRLVFPSGV